MASPNIDREVRDSGLAPEARRADPVNDRLWAFVLSPFAIAATAEVLHLIENGFKFEGAVRPFGIGFVAPIALLTLWGGWEAGLFSVLLADIALAFFLVPTDAASHATDSRNWIELTMLTLVSLIVIYGLNATRKNRELVLDMKEAQERLIESEAQRERFNREVLLAVTGGRLQLCTENELHALVANAPQFAMPLQRMSDVSELRRMLRYMVEESHVAERRLDDLLTSVSEASTNAIKHASGGRAEVWMGSESVSVLITDSGHGIHPSQLARATLEQGFSSRATLGIGFTLMLQFVDQLALSTSDRGTQVLIRVGSEPMPSPQSAVLAQYASLAPMATY